MNQLLDKTVVGGIGVIGLLPISLLTPLEIPHTIWSWVLAFFVADFTYYWMHRLEHEHRILWPAIVCTILLRIIILL
ncbi:sterol desaturase family protein [Aquimarina hainanensis]|uniref:sterol desaturase family protein n=1 Tax=Aquimarina hainanensis TaxID=1578017 RepID=UPI00361D7688